MIRSIATVFLATVAMTASVQALEVYELAPAVTQKLVANAVHQQMTFKAGDTASYSLNIASFIQGTMVMTVKSVSPSALVIDQNMDLGTFGKQDCVETVNPATGALTSLVCNGQAQTPNQGTQTVEKESHETITVAAGTFKCIYAKLKNSSDNSESEVWINQTQVPVGGLVKTLQNTQVGQADIELTSFHAN